MKENPSHLNLLDKLIKRTSLLFQIKSKISKRDRMDLVYRIQILVSLIEINILKNRPSQKLLLMMALEDGKIKLTDLLLIKIASKRSTIQIS